VGPAYAWWLGGDSMPATWGRPTRGGWGVGRRHVAGIVPGFGCPLEATRGASRFTAAEQETGLGQRHVDFLSI